MAISVAWVTGIISVPKADTTFFGTDPLTGREIRTFDTEQFHKDLRALQETQEGRPGFPITHNYESASIIDGVTFAAKITINTVYYQVEFEDGTYRVVLQNTNNNIASAAVVNQVSVQPGNSAGLIGSEAINNQSYLEGRVWIDTVNGNAGSSFDFGTPSNRVNNYPNAYTILSTRNLVGFHLESPMLVLTVSDVIAGTSWRGEAADVSRLTLNSSQSSLNCVFEQMVLLGNANGRITGRSVILASLTGVDGSFKDSGFNGTVIFDSNAVQTQTFVNCYSVMPGDIKPILDLNSANADVQFRGYKGGLEIRNFNQGNNMSIDMESGSITLDSTCTAGTIKIRGDYELEDNSGPGCTVIAVQSTVDLTEVTSWARKASDNAEQANQKLN